jgi:PhoPQ-activated pathogenicity-related protein
LLPLLVALLAFSSGLRLAAADTARIGATSTALDRYVARPDPAFRWKKVAEVREEGATSHILDLVSQHWLTPAEVDRPEWRHWLVVIRPDALAHRTGLLVISGGSNRPGPPPKPSRDLVETARATRSVVAELRMVPNQPLVFRQDGRERKEDDLIAYTWDQYLKTGDERWPARLPMTTAAVRAMDAVTAFLATAEGGDAAVETFVVAGGSKRGWTAWTTAIVDRRVVALCPLVIDILNVEVSMAHHHRAYGFFAPAVGDYTTHHIMDWSGAPEAKALYAIEDPFSYRDRLTMPKLLINACGDQFFAPDSSQFHFDELPGVKYLRYIPNADHSLKSTDASRTLAAWHHAILNQTPLPQFSWQQRADGSLMVATKTTPRQVRLWQATNPSARDFRLETLGPVWTATPIEGKDGVFATAVPPPAEGWTAFLMELVFDVGAPAPLKLTTNVIVTPGTLPFPAPDLTRPKGFLSK